MTDASGVVISANPAAVTMLEPDVLVGAIFEELPTLRGASVVETTDHEVVRRTRLMRSGGPVVMEIVSAVLAGFAVLERIRRTDQRIAVLMLSARQDESDILRGLQLGADDYLTKPFRPKELVARVKAILLRAMTTHGRPTPQIYRTGDVELDEATHEVRAAHLPVHLSPTEFKLLRHFMANPSRVLTQEEIFEAVWGYDAEVGGDLVKLNVSRLRRKLTADGQTRDIIQTVPGVGYLFRGADGGVEREESRPPAT